ncbi:neprilysin-1 [Orussus abietinus]|uniref:neprilysin-1 n=1 Tax=Orussus abietinus TaxID=222816 RepID=UPI000C715EAA|nr:neprilysin-1 [Orussus abietinus]
MNPNESPCDDFYEYACGNFKYHHQPGKSQLTTNQFRVLERKTNNLLQDILSQPIIDEDIESLKKAKLEYQSCIDKGTINPPL